jgi:hypothetical protein
MGDDRDRRDDEKKPDEPPGEESEPVAKMVSVPELIGRSIVGSGGAPRDS